MSRSATPLFRQLYARCVRPLRLQLALLLFVSFVTNIVMALQPVILAGMLAVLLGTPGDPVGAAPSVLLDLSSLGARVTAWLPASARDATRSVPLLGMAFLIQVVLVALLTYVGSTIAHRIKVRSTHLLQADLGRHLMSLGLRFFHRERAGELHSRFLQDTRNTAQGTGPLVQNILNDTMQVALFGALLFSTSAWLTVGAIALGAVHFAIGHLMKTPNQKQVRLGLDTWATLSTTLQESLANIRVIKSFGAEKFELRKLRSAIDRVMQVNWRYGFLQYAEAPVRSIIDAIAILGILLIAVIQLRAGLLTTQGVLMYLYVGRLVITPISHMGTNVVVAQTLVASYGRLEELFAQRPDIASGIGDRSAFNDRIEIDNVSFAYLAERVINGATFDICRGEMVAIVGPSGAGKSTLLDLILRLYDPDQGTIRIDGVDVRALKSRSYLRLFGVVPQESQLFHDTVRDNIRYGRTELTDEDIVSAATIANAHGFISSLPQGYDTLIGDRGIRLSGGERQRIAIARAVVHSPQILVMDEATSSLDSESERQVQQAIDQILKQMTAIVIAHRLSTVLHADKIVVVDHGRVVDCGRHSELLSRCELYRSLCELQFQTGGAVSPPQR